MSRPQAPRSLQARLLGLLLALLFVVWLVTALMTWFAIGERMGGLAMLGMAVTVAGVAMAVRRQAL